MNDDLRMTPTKALIVIITNSAWILHALEIDNLEELLRGLSALKD